MAQPQTLADVFSAPAQSRQQGASDFLSALIAPKPPVAIPLDVMEPVAGQPYPGWAPTGTAIGSVALEFLKGLRQAKVARAMEQEQEAQSSMASYIAAAQERLNDADLTPEARQRAEQQMMMTLARHASRELKDTPRKGIGGAIRGFLSSLAGGDIPTREPVNFKEAMGQLLVWTDPKLNPEGRQSYWIGQANNLYNQEIQKLSERYGGYVPPEAAIQKAAEIAASLDLQNKAPNQLGTWLNMVQLRAQGLTPQEELKYQISAELLKSIRGAEAVPAATGTAAAATEPAPTPVVSPPVMQTAAQPQGEAAVVTGASTAPRPLAPMPAQPRSPSEAAAVPSEAIQAFLEATSPAAKLATVPAPAPVASSVVPPAAPADRRAESTPMAPVGASAPAEVGAAPPAPTALSPRIQQAMANPFARQVVYELAGVKPPAGPTVLFNPRDPDQYAWAMHEPLSGRWIDPTTGRPLPADQQQWVPKDQLPPGAGQQRYELRSYYDDKGIERFIVFDNRTKQTTIVPFVGGGMSPERLRVIQNELDNIGKLKTEHENEVRQYEQELNRNINAILENFSKGVYSKSIQEGGMPLYDDRGRLITTPDQMRDYLIERQKKIRDLKVSQSYEKLAERLRHDVYPRLRAFGAEDFLRRMFPEVNLEDLKQEEEQEPQARGTRRVGGAKEKPEDFGYAPRHPERAPGAESTPQEREHYRSMVRQRAESAGVPADLAEAVARQESGFKPWALSDKNAMGIMQIIPSTARALGLENPWDPQQNIDAGVRLLADLLRKHNGSLMKALAEYNGGPSAASATKISEIPYAETRNYVRSILRSLGYQDEEDMSTARIPVPSAQPVQQAAVTQAASPKAPQEPANRPRVPTREEVTTFFRPAAAPGKGGAAGAVGGPGKGTTRVPQPTVLPRSGRGAGYRLPETGAK